MHTPLPEWALWSEIAIRVGWAATAAVICLVMSRRGHDIANWAIVGLVLGPFAVLAAIISARRADRRGAIVVEQGDDRDARVLVVLDPAHPESWRMQAEMVNELDATAELVVVVSRDTLDRPARDGTLRRARTALAAAAAAVAAPTPRQLILEGRPAAAVVSHARSLTASTIILPPNSLGDQLRGSLAVELPAVDVRPHHQS